jgi:acylphosphatase
VPETVRVRVKVVGRVQGVFFRVSCAREARGLGVAGSVRNLADGSVEAVFEGHRAEVDAMVGWCRQGPPGARVARLDVDDEVPVGVDGFSIEG